MLVGDSAVGKTCLLTPYTCKEFPTDYIPTTFGGHAETVMVGDVPYTLCVFDTLGTTEYDRMRPLSYSQSDIFLVCFSVGIPPSFESVREKWFPEAHHHCPGVPCVVAATQVDLQDDDKARAGTIMTAQGEKLARELKAAAYVECSAKTHEGVQRAFDTVVAATVKYQQGLVVERKKKKCIVV
ncbi:P-loop containing nucleoside triphosphate hydrolase protein [Mycena olivaceomarginata]|nr:P-loop containing nucleoside triphosphate hydrolase protein [Mycena olivaceomarginata]